MNLPNSLTLLRVLLIPLFVIFIINRYCEGALITFAIAGVTDAVDGLLARLTHQRTELGAYLDPIADKLLLSSAFITLAITERIPGWVSVIVVARDVIILIGFLMFFLTNHRPQMGPSVISKVTTFLQIATVLLALSTDFVRFPVFALTLTHYGVVLFTILSGVHYIYIGTLILNEKRNH